MTKLALRRFTLSLLLFFLNPGVAPAAELSPREESAIREYLLRNDGLNYLVQDAFTEKFVNESLEKVKRLLPLADAVIEEVSPTAERYRRITEWRIKALTRWVDNMGTQDDLYKDEFKKKLEARLLPLCCKALEYAEARKRLTVPQDPE